MTAAHDGPTALLGPAALGVVDRLGELDDEPGLSEELEPSAVRAEAVLAAVAADRTRARSRARRWQAVIAAAASVVVLAAGVVAATALAGSAPERPLLCNLNASVLRADAVGFVVQDAAGQEVLAADL